MSSLSKLSARRSLVLGASSIVAVVALGARPAWGAKAAKADFSYRESPNDGKSCASCRLFTPTVQDKGRCAVVEGEVSSHGWCTAYSARQASPSG